MARTSGRLAENIAVFAQALRGAGLKIGPAAIADAVAAVAAGGLSRREDFYWILHSSFVRRREDSAVFREAFDLFWRHRGLAQGLSGLSAAVPEIEPEGEPRAERQRVRQRVAEAFAVLDQQRQQHIETEFDMRETQSAEEVLRSKDFAEMSTAELDEARKAVSRMVLPDDRVRQRRHMAASKGRRIDMRATMRGALGAGGAMRLKWQAPRVAVPPLVAILDISGSMSEYSRIMLHFLHAMSQRREVHSFLFGTRFSNVTRALSRRDPDAALAACAAQVPDWSGGTRIASALHAFNRFWSRRVLGRGAIVLLVTDGLERDDGAHLSFEMDRLGRSCRRLIWLNPLLRYDGFEARAAGIRAMLPHVDDFRTVHNLAAIADICRALSADAPGRAAA
ncbi:MAG: VWA domain-containing protein [Flavobacteriaceae bacterium]